MQIADAAKVFCMGFGPRSADFGTATFVNGERPDMQNFTQAVHCYASVQEAI